MYVTVEGIDGAGTTSVTKELAIEFRAWETCEPSDLWTGRITRESFERRDVSDLSRFYLFMADRAEHVEEIINQHDFVISDRGPDSTRAYQYHTSGLSDAFIELNLAQTRSPELTIWIDVDLDTAVERMDGKDAFENRELLEKVDARYRKLWKKHDRIRRVDGNQPLEGVIADAKTIINDTQ